MKNKIGIVTEDTSALPSQLITKHQIGLVNIKYDWPTGLTLPGENIYQKMREANRRGIKDFPKSSQPSPKAYQTVFEQQLKIFDQVLLISISSKLSGSYNSAKMARSLCSDSSRIFLFDSQTAAGGQALMILKAIELIEKGKEIPFIIEELEKSINDIQLVIIIEDPKWLESSGRISKTLASWIRKLKKINFYPVIKLEKGVISKKSSLIYASTIVNALFKMISKKRTENLKVIINHADNLEVAEKLQKLLIDANIEVCFVNIGPQILSIAGPGTVIVSWMLNS